MFNSITWGQYLTTLTLLSVCYYAFIGFRYYRWEILGAIGIKKIKDNAMVISTVADFKKTFESESHEDYLPKPALEIDISPLVLSFTDEVKAYLQGANTEIPKEELLHSVESIILKYPVLKDADYKQELVQFIFDEANARYPNLIPLKEVKQLLN